MSSLPPPRELEEIDDGWGEEGAQPAALAPPRAPDLAGCAVPMVTANPPVADHQRTELEALRTALSDVQRELDRAKGRIRVLESRNASAEAELGAARIAQHELGQQLEAARATEQQLRQQLDGMRTRAATAGGDDLQAIKGIGPKLSKKLQEVGISSYADLAALDADGVATLAELLGIPKSRIERNGWVEAARQLAASASG